MERRLTWEKRTLKLRNPFRLSYGTTEERQVYWIRLAHDEGWGESAIPPYYGVDSESMEELWREKSQSPVPFPETIETIEPWVGFTGPAPARCALDLALHDRIGKCQGKPLYSLLDLPKPQPIATSFTIAIDTPEEMARMAANIKELPIIKVKLGSEDDEARLAAIRSSRPDALLRVDANAGWTRENALKFIDRLARYDLEMIEQPLDKQDIEGMGLLQEQTAIPIMADESLQREVDLERIAAAGVAGINLKLMKTGGITPALRILKRAKQLGLKVMLGCMIESSLGTTAMAHLGGLADWLDLDAPMLISNDDFEGLVYDNHARITIPDRPGIGAILK